MRRTEYEKLIHAVVEMGSYNCTGTKCASCPLALDSVCMVVAMARQLVDFEKAGSIIEDRKEHT